MENLGSCIVFEFKRLDIMESDEGGFFNSTELDTFQPTALIDHWLGKVAKSTFHFQLNGSAIALIPLQKGRTMFDFGVN